MKRKLSTKIKTHVNRHLKHVKRVKEAGHMPFATASLVIILVGFSFMPSFTFCEQKVVPDYVPGLWLVYSKNTKIEIQCEKDSMWEYMRKTSQY